MVANKTTAQIVGQTGENLAVDHLLQSGYQILDRNFKIRLGELDIVALDQDQVVLVEVKTRSGTKFGLPEEAINKKKLTKIKQVGQVWVRQHPQFPQSLRIDLIAILGDKIKHYKNIGDFS
ncbi:MAG: YraN family protein [Patescibacteria group bacterium]